MIGYKCFNEDMTNRYGISFEVGKIYVIFGTIQFGIHGHGFHMCKNMEDPLRYIDAMKSNDSICKLRGSGQLDSNRDEYNRNYDMFAVEKLEILKKLSREEIIEMALDFNWCRVIRFLKGFRLTEEERELFRKQFCHEPSVLDIISYYQDGDLDTFVRKVKVYHG